MKRLWFQLAVTYTVLAICAFATLVMILYGISDYQDFHETLTLKNVETQILSEQIAVAEAIRDKSRAEWQKRALDDIREKLVNLEQNDKEIEIYRITNSSRPEVYMRVSDAAGQPLISDPSHFPPAVAERFTSQQPPITENRIAWVSGNSGPIWVDMPITDDDGNFNGRLQILYVAEFDWWVQLSSIMSFLLLSFDWLIYCSIPIGIICGLVASRYVTKQLLKMNEVTESWRQGNFEARIELPNDDVLTRHSQHLNDMAQDLEMYLSLKQNLAVSDERTRLARELHDTVKQKLFALGLQLATAKAGLERPNEHILEAETITREAQHDVMEIITQLRLAGTSELSLHDRIAMIADDFKRRFHVGIDISHSHSARFNAHTEHHVLRIVQESLMNAVRHGKATHIVIISGIDHETATLTISDNGGGFDTAQKTNGFGIISMRDRVRDLPQGRFDMKSTAGSGTEITITWKNES